LGGPTKHVLGGVHNVATWRKPVNSPCAAVVQPAIKLLQPLVFITKLERGPMLNVMAALPNIGGAICSTVPSLADAQY